jgi:hypothetical protein
MLLGRFLFCCIAAPFRPTRNHAHPGQLSASLDTTPRTENQRIARCARYAGESSRREFEDGRRPDNLPEEQGRCFMKSRSRTLKVAVIAVAVVITIAAWSPRASAQVITLPTIEEKCYVIPPGRALNTPATLTDQFDTEDVLVQQPLYLCNPATKTFAGGTFGGPTVTIPVPPGATTVTIAVPHLKCYKITPSKTVNETVTLTDQFGTETDVKVTTPQFLCTTVTKTVTTTAIPRTSGSDQNQTLAFRVIAPEFHPTLNISKNDNPSRNDK